MPFEKFEFTKDWKNPTDFATVETDEAQVRADMQLLHDEAKAAVHALIDALFEPTGADNIGTTLDGAQATLQTVLNALLDAKHKHADQAGVDEVAANYKGTALTETLVRDHTKVPTSAAVLDSMAEAGLGDMQRSVYDPNGKGMDVFAYAEQMVGEHVSEENPHGITAEMLGLGNVSDTSDEDKPLSTAAQTALDGKVDKTAVIDIAHGGTGATTVAGARNALGLGNTSGALPVANGGTGATTVAAARNNLGLGNTSGALPVANGGTGATSASAARTALAAMGTAGGSFTGTVTLKGIKLTSGTDYGTSYPTSGLAAGRLFFKKV